MEKVDLITISRQFGAGGSNLAVALGRRLGWSVLDRDIIHEAAARLDTDVAHTGHLDEYVTSALERLVKDIATALPDAVIEPMYEVDPDDLARATHRVLLGAVQRRSPLIVVGHGVQCLFEQRPHTLHVRVVAPVVHRARCISERLKLDLEPATAEVQRRDRDRARYLRHHFDRDNSDPNLYAIQFNTAYVSVAEVTNAIAQLVH